MGPDSEVRESTRPRSTRPPHRQPHNQAHPTNKQAQFICEYTPLLIPRHPPVHVCPFRTVVMSGRTIVGRAPGRPSFPPSCPSALGLLAAFTSPPISPVGVHVRLKITGHLTDRLWSVDRQDQARPGLSKSEGRRPRRGQAERGVQGRSRGGPPQLHSTRRTRNSHTPTSRIHKGRGKLILHISSSAQPRTDSQPSGPPF